MVGIRNPTSMRLVEYEIQQLRDGWDTKSNDYKETVGIQNPTITKRRWGYEIQRVRDWWDTKSNNYKETCAACIKRPVQRASRDLCSVCQEACAACVYGDKETLV